jgi:hypothetical protein
MSANVLSMSEGYLGAMEGYFYNEYEGIHVKGWFKAPRTGSYNFLVSGDDGIQFFINPEKGSVNRSGLVSIAYSCGAKAMRNYWMPWYGCDSSAI